MDAMETTLDLDELSLDILRAFSHKGGLPASIVKRLRPLFEHWDVASKDAPTMLSGACELIQRRKVMRLWSEQRTRSLFLVFSSVSSDAIDVDTSGARHVYNSRAYVVFPDGPGSCTCSYYRHGIILGQREPVCSAAAAVVSVSKSTSVQGQAGEEEHGQNKWEVDRRYCKHLLAVHLSLALAEGAVASPSVDEAAEAAPGRRPEEEPPRLPYVEQVERNSYWRMIATGRPL